MKKIYPIAALTFLLFCQNTIFAQCSVNISTDINTTQLNCTHTTIRLTANAPEAKKYLWSTGDTISSIGVTEAGLYTLTISTDACSSSSSIRITKDITPPTVTAFAFPGTICLGDSAALIALGAQTYSWKPDLPAEAVVSVAPALTTKYTVTGTGANGCTGTGTVQVVVNRLPTAFITGAASVCQNAAEPIITFTGAGGTAPYTFTYDVNGGPARAISTSSSDTIAHINASTATLGTTTYRIKLVSDSNGCAQTATGEAAVSVDPGPILTSAKTVSTCDNAPFTYTATSSSNGTNFSWTRDVVPGISNAAASGSTATISETLDNTTSQPILVNYVFTLSTNGSCVSTVTVGVIVNSTRPVLTSPKTVSICNNTPFSYTATSSSKGTIFSWTGKAPDSVEQTNTSGATESITDTYHNTTTQPLAVLYTITLSTGAGCVTTDVVSVIVNPTPSIDSSTIKDTSFCNGTFVDSGFVFKSSSPGAFFSWSNSDTSIGLAASGSGNILPFRAKNNTNQLIKATITVLVQASKDSCTGTTPMTFAITVRPAPVLTSVKDISLCDSTMFNYAATSSAPSTTFNWSRAAVDDISIPPVNSTKDSSINETLHNTSALPKTVNYVFTLSTAGTGCVTTETVRVKVNPTPVIDPISDTIFCSGQFVKGGIKFTSKSPDSSFTWTTSNNHIGLPDSGRGSLPAFIAANTSSTVDSAVIMVNMTASANSCKGVSASFIIKVRPGPLLTSEKTASICDNTVFNYTATSNTDKTTFRWQRTAVDDINNKSDSGETATIKERLDNTGNGAKDVFYVFKLYSGSECYTTDSVKVTVNPTPKIDTTNIHNYLICNNNLVQPILFKTPTLNPSLTWTSDKSIGFGTSGTGSIPAFIANNQSDSAASAKIMVKISIGKDCSGDSLPFSITVLPTPVLTSVKDTSVCDNVFFTYKARSYAKGTTFSWIRDVVPGISTARLTGTTADINEPLHNTTTQPIVVTYVFALSTGPDCSTKDLVKVTVNPTPVLLPISNYIFCNGTSVSAIKFRSSSPNASFTWNSDKTVGFGSTGKDSIPSFTATNTSADPIVAKVNVSVKASADQCPGPDSSFTITVNPSPAKPHFTSLSRYADKDTAQVCTGSENINFNVNLPAVGISYKWMSTADPSTLFIRDTSHANTVVSFSKAGDYTVKAIAKNTTGGCTDTVSQLVHVDRITTGVDKRKIFLMQPGNLLVYPDNSLQGYQWSYDTIMHTLTDSAFGSPTPIQGQVYEFFNPPAKFINSGNSLNKTDYLYSVLLQNKGCYTRVYYNGPYADRIAQAIVPDSIVQLQVMPNPNNGRFTVALKGNIYGRIDAKLYNSLGQVVYGTNFMKTSPEVNQIINTGNLPGGLYFLEMLGSDLKKVVSRFVIQH